MRFFGAENQLTQPIYDTMQLAAGVGVYPFFTVPLNGVLTAAANKTYAHTNLVQAGRLEKGIELTITGVAMHIRDIASGGAQVSFADYINVYAQTWIDLLIGQVSFLRIDAYQCPPGPAEINYYSNIAAAVTEFKSTKGLGSAMNLFRLENPLILEDQESIAVDLHIETAIVAVTDVSMVLYGTQTRPVR